MVYDGSGGKPFKADVGIVGDEVVKIGDLTRALATTTIDATGMAVAPGFINMLSWATESMIVVKAYGAQASDQPLASMDITRTVVGSHRAGRSLSAREGPSPVDGKR